MKICASRPAAAAYAASALPAFPAEGIASFLRPRALATLIATVIPRALNEPVGFRPSSLIQTFGNSRLRRSGVNPSPSVIGSTLGRTSRYLHRLAALPLSESGLKCFFKVCRSYRAKRIPPSLEQTFSGISAGRCAPHLVHSMKVS